MSDAPASAPDRPMVRLEAVHKSFGDKRVLDGLDLDVAAGETLVIMGPSGTGKSVTLRHVIGIVRPDEGRVLVDGVDVHALELDELRTLRRRMGYLFQEGALINWLSAGENVALPLRENTDLADAEIRERVEERLEMVHLAGNYDVMPSSLSGGMRKRVSLARALVTDPEIVLYDEPNAGLDPRTSSSINDLIRELADRLEITSMVVTHRVACVRTVADRVVLLEQGRIAFEGDREAFFERPNERLRHFLGSEDPD